MRRLLVRSARITGELLSLEPDESRYLFRVLRMRAGDTVEVRDGAGGAFEAAAVDKRTLALGPRHELPMEPGARVHLLFAPIKGKRMDVLLEKATEIGAASLQPVHTERGVRVSKQEALERWERVVWSAARQCEAARVPTLHEPCTLKELASRPCGYDLKLVLHPAAAEPLRSALKARSAADVAVLTGPEGGFTDAELACLEGWSPISLGPRILRAETAPVVALTLIRHRLSDLG